MQTPTARVVMMVVITIRNGGDLNAAIERDEMMVVITISNSDVAGTKRERGDDGCDHYQAVWR